jgi:hypothetical protein
MQLTTEIYMGYYGDLVHTCNNNVGKRNRLNSSLVQTSQLPQQESIVVASASRKRGSLPLPFTFQLVFF